jgi:hypothetical protein
MSTYFLHDGQNELGPFTLDLLKKQKISRTTPVRLEGSDNWVPAEKLEGLKDLVVPLKIRRPKDIAPVVKEKITQLKEKEPRILYGSLLCIALILGVSIFSVTQSGAKEPPPVAATLSPVITSPQNVAVVEETEVKKEKEEAIRPVVQKVDEAKTTRLRWNKLITATNSNYGIGLLGGIKDLSIILSNRTDYPIDEAVAKVTYIKANGSTWKTKLITINGVPAHDSKEQSVPDVGRGKKVKVTLQKVISKKMNFSYTEGKKGRDPEDPYVL